MLRRQQFSACCQHIICLYDTTHGLRIWILRILKFPRIHDFFFTNFKTDNFKIYKIQIITYIETKFQQTLLQAQHLTFGSKNLMSTIIDSLTRQQFSVVLQSRRIACSFTVFPSVRIGVLSCPLFPFNSCLSVIDCREITVLKCNQCCANWKTLQLLVNVIIRIFTIDLFSNEFFKFRKIRKFLRILKLFKHSSHEFSIKKPFALTHAIRWWHPCWTAHAWWYWLGVAHSGNSCEQAVSVSVATQYVSAPCKLTISSHLFARWHLFWHVGYLRHQQQVDL